MKKYLQSLLKQSSTYKGLALLAGAAASAGGVTELFNVQITGNDVEFGGVIGTTAVLGLGAWETFRNQMR
ncbi:hypothetical protein [Photobacterium halotolerans]|uniref:Holin n=1 Tax=Photobacterium halotolerans TaxID=265726 RepID=A0A7X4WCH6_9GAMM|nr:hypothetical protein [Photobacterium halotolerans]NAW66148.1 hypothetical protein [Photobacterium halotolerans]